MISKWLTVHISVWILILMCFQMAVAGVGLYIEEFDHTSYRDKTHTNALWDTTTGTLSLYPFVMNQMGIQDTPGSANKVAIDGNYAFVADSAGGLQVIDISNPFLPDSVGSYDTPGQANDIAVAGDYAFLADGSEGLQVIGIADPMNPTCRGSFNTSGHAMGVTILGHYAYVADGSEGLVIIDIKYPDSPSYVNSIANPGDDARDVAVYGNYAFVADYSFGLRAVDITDPENPNWEGNYSSPQARSIAIAGNYAYLTSGSNGFKVFDISDPGNLGLVGSCAIPGDARDVALCGDYAYVTGDGLHLVDISDTSMISVLQSYATTDSTKGISIAGDYACVAVGPSGLEVVDIADVVGDPVLIGRCQSISSATNVIIDGDYAYVTDGDLKVVDISDPKYPVLKSLETPGDANSIEISGNYAFLADGDPSLLVIDISAPDQSRLGGTLKTPGDAPYITISGCYAFIADGWPGVEVIDISDPLYPDSVAVVAEMGWNYPSEHLTIRGDSLYVADSWEGLRIVDISNPLAPQKVAQYTTLSAAVAVSVQGQYAYVACEGAGLQVIDCNIPADSDGWNVGSYDTPGIACHVVVRGDSAYVADGDSGLVIINTVDPESLYSVGRYSTPGSLVYLTAEGNNLFAAVDGTGLIAYQIVDSSGITAIDTLDYEGNPKCIAIDGSYAYIANYLTFNEPTGLEIVDISNPINMSIQGSCSIPGHAVSVAVDGEYAFVTSSDWGIWVVDVRSPVDPMLIRSFDNYGYSHDIAISGDVAYIAESGDKWREYGLRTVDICNVDSLKEIGVWDPHPIGSAYPTVRSVEVVGNLAYLVDLQNLWIVDIQDPDSMFSIGVNSEPFIADDVTIEGNYAFVADTWFGLSIYDISDPNFPTYVTRYNWPGDAYAVEVAGDYAFVASYTSGLRIFDISEIWSGMPLKVLAQYNATNTLDVSIHGDYAFLADREEGLLVTQVFSRETKPGLNVAQSLPIAETQRDIVHCLLSAITNEADSIRWQISAAPPQIDISGDPPETTWTWIWTDVLSGGSGYTLSSPDSLPVWRAHIYNVGDSSGPPVCDTLTIEWWFDCAWIDTIKDIPDDQGGWARAEFIRSGYDFADDSSPIIRYGLWRRVDDKVLLVKVNREAQLDSVKKAENTLEVNQSRSAVGKEDRSSGDRGSMSSAQRIPWHLEQLSGRCQIITVENRVFLVSLPGSKDDFPDGTWEAVGSVPATQQDTLYIATVPTVQDSVPTFFCVSAHREDPSEWYVSPVVSGQSEDNVPPKTTMVSILPKGEGRWPAAEDTYKFSENCVFLTWQAVTTGEDGTPEPWPVRYRIYCGTDPNFNPGPSSRITTTSNLSYTHTDPRIGNPDENLYYVVRAMDQGKNESVASNRVGEFDRSLSKVE